MDNLLIWATGMAVAWILAGAIIILWEWLSGPWGEGS